jgi:hypothetical protein
VRWCLGTSLYLKEIFFLFFALPINFLAVDLMFTTYIYINPSTITTIYMFPSIHQQSQHFTHNSNNNHNNIHFHQSSTITTIQNQTTNLCLVIYMNKVYIQITCKTQSMTQKNIVAHELVSSLQTHESLLKDVQ